jgi:hypothetical protein
MGGPTSARSPVALALGLASVAFVILLMILEFGARPAAGKQKTHDRFRPWVLVESVVSASTGPRGLAAYDDDQQNDLSNPVNHCPQTSGAPGDTSSPFWLQF